MVRARRGSSVPAPITKWYDQHNSALWLGLLALLIAYIIGSRGIDTGSWWEYLGTLLFLAIGFNRLIVAIRVGKSKAR